MTRRQTYYDLFGLNYRATPQEIRASYLRLLKQHHPDLVRNGAGTRKPELVPLINRCYSVLRDPKKRAAYDAQLRRPAVAPPAPPSRQLALARRRRTVWPAAALFIGAFTVTSILAIELVAPSRLRSLTDPVGWPVPAYHPVPSTTISLARRPEAIHRQAHLARSVSNDRAIYLSNKCFAAARRHEDRISAELCVVFDQAFIYWRKAPGDLPYLPIYFNDEVAKIRDVGALAAAGVDNTDEKLESLREEAFRALLEDVSGSNQTIARDTTGVSPAQETELAGADDTAGVPR